MVLKLFKKLNKEIGQTIIMVTHEPDDKKYVDRVIWLKDGVIEDWYPCIFLPKNIQGYFL